MSIDDVRKRGKGRPAINAVPVTVRIPPNQLSALDAWIDHQPGELSRPEAVRRLMEIGLKGQ